MESVTDISVEQIIQKNIARWQDVGDPLAPLSDSQLDVLYQMEDVVKQIFFGDQPENIKAHDENIIHANTDFVRWMVNIENRMKDETHIDFLRYCSSLQDQTNQCGNLLWTTESVIEHLKALNLRHQNVIAKTDSLHILSDELMKHQTELRNKSLSIKEKLKYFTLYESLHNNFESIGSNVNTTEFINMLDQIDLALKYIVNHPNFKESYSYKIKYENLLVSALQNVLKIIEQVINDATNQVSTENRSLLNVNNQADLNLDSAFSFYYGKYENASEKVSKITKFLEQKMDHSDMYKRTVEDCQNAYFTQRVAIMVTAVSTALFDLREKHKGDHSTLFRSAVLFVVKICRDEALCFHHFFSSSSQRLENYLGAICQTLYDMLRPCLINVNHLEVLTELCTILKQMLNDEIQSNDTLDQLVETIMQLVHDVEERLVFRVNIFFQHDLFKYEPSPGDLAYPEKLQEIEDIAGDISDRRAESRLSTTSVELQENNLGNYVGQFRSYTGNSPADLHGMWYPTVKRTLVCLSRLYICLDREIFQGLAQEALIICIKTVDTAAEKISAQKSLLDGHMFHIKHLLIIREQIAPFQVDFTAKEMSLDFSTVRTAAVDLIQKRDKLFTLGSNNALLEFLLEGTPKVKEYLVDSRKEIDKQLKSACESFITNATDLLIGDLLCWTQKATRIKSNTVRILLKEQEFGQPKYVGEIISSILRQLKSQIPDIQKAMRLYLANRETEFILFKPIKNNILNGFILAEQILVDEKYSQDDQLVIACPTTEQLNVLICSVSLTIDQDYSQPRMTQSRHSEHTSNIQ